MAKNSSPLRPKIIGLEIGEKVDFPIHRMASVKTSCSELALIYNRKFKTKLNRKQETITVSRIK